MRLLGLLLLAFLWPIVGHAQYPTKQVRMVVPYPPGGGTDIVARPVAQKLTERWGQSVVIENRGGATGMIGTEIVTKAAPDGYTILFSASPEIVINQHLYAKMAYDAGRDLAPVSMGAYTPMIWVTHPSFPAKGMKEFEAIAKAKPDQVNYGSSGAGSPHHVVGEWFRYLTKARIVHVAYKGGGPQLNDQLGGHAISGVFTMPVTTQHVRAGRLKGLAVTSAKRSPALPDVPSMKEQGYDLEAIAWFAVSLPAATSKDIVNKVNADVNWALTQSEVRARLEDQGYTAAPNSPDEFAKFIRAEIAKYATIVRNTGMKLN